MGIPKQKFREVVFQMLYSCDLGHATDDDLIELLMKELSITRKTCLLALERARDILAIREEIDTMITQATLSYDFNRIQTVERNVLRLGVYELFFDELIPKKVAISEAMRLARKFGSPESARFVNAVLDSLYKISRGEQIDPKQISLTFEEIKQGEDKAKKASKIKKTSNNKESLD